MVDQHDVGLHSDEFACIEAGTIGIAASPTKLDVHVAAVGPPQLLQPLLQCGDATLSLWIALGEDGEHADPPHAVRLLRARRERPSNRRAADERDEIAAPDHSITSSARASSIGGTSRPSAFAVLRLITSSILVGRSIGRSCGFA